MKKQNLLLLKMKKQNLLQVLIVAMTIGVCALLIVAMMEDWCAKETHKDVGEYSDVNDTLFVVGVLNQPATYRIGPKKYLSCVNKNGKEYEVKVPLSHGGTIKAGDRDNVVSYIERGDTIVLQNGKIVKDLTMENMKSKYVHGR